MKNNAPWRARFSPYLFALLHPLWRLYDAIVPKRADHWAFATHHLHTGRFIENQRALFEYIKAKQDIRKIIFYRGQKDDFQIEDAVNFELVEHGTLRGLALLARCKVVFLTHSIAMDFSLRWGGKAFSILKLALRQRVVVNLWHGIPLKRLLYAANDETRKHTDRVHYRTQERRQYAGLIASSDIDSYAMAAMFYPLNYQQVWCTGLPRNDFLRHDDHHLPRYIRDSIDAIRRLRQGRKLVLYAPTYRQTGAVSEAWYYQFSDAEIAALKVVLRKNKAILGYRPHYFKNSTQFFNLEKYIDNDLIFDVSQAVVPEFSALAREGDLLITDYSSVYIESLYLGKPVVSFAYDLAHYKTCQDGLLYDMALAFPGPICESFSDVLAAIDDQLSASGVEKNQDQNMARQMFFKYQDADNCKRVFEAVVKRLG
jgi:CDP-glycerol glycerophosphotransferase